MVWSIRPPVAPNIYKVYVGDICQSPSDSFRLVVMLLLVLLNDYIRMLSLHGRRQGIHVADDHVRPSFEAEDVLAVAEIFGERTVAAYREVCCLYEIAWIFGLRKLTVTDYDHCLAHALCLLACYLGGSPLRGRVCLRVTETDQEILRIMIDN